MSTSRLKHKDTIEGQEPLKFDNMFGELEFYKKRCEVLEKDLIKSQNTIKKMDVSLKKLQEINIINAKSLNNTSIPFFLTSEFKNNWENFAKDQIMEAFENTFDNYFWLAHIVQDTVLIIYQETNLVIFQKIVSILKILNIDEKHPDKFISRFRTFFQEYFMSIFIFTDEILLKIKSKLYDVITKYKSFDDNINEGIKKDIESKSFKSLAQIVFKLCIYMLLHEPQLTLSIQPYEKREFSYNFYNKTEYLNIEGFGNEHSSCITILGPPMIRNYLPFQGIKPCVYIIPQPEEEIVKCCERNKASRKALQVERVDNHASNVNINEKTDKTSSPVKSEKKCKEINNETESNTPNFPIPTFIERQSIPKGNRIVSTVMKESLNPVQIAVKEKIPTNFTKFNKNIGKEVVNSENSSNNAVSVNEGSSTVNQCYNHPLSLNKKKIVNEKFELDDNHLKSNYRIISQQIKTNSKNSSKSCSLNTSLKNDALKLSEINEAYENIIKTSQRQNSSRTTLNTIDQPLYRDSMNANKNMIVNGTDNISLSRKKNMVSMKQNSIPIDPCMNSDINELVYKEIEDNSKNTYPIKTNNVFEMQNNVSDYSSRIGNNEKNYFLIKNQQFVRKKTSITPDNEIKQFVKESEIVLKKSVETNSASNLIKKIKNPLDNTLEKRKGEVNGNVVKATNTENDKVFSSTVVQKKGLNIGIKINKNVKTEVHYEGPHTNRYDLPEMNNEMFTNNNVSKYKATKNTLNKNDNKEGNERNVMINKLSSNFKNNYEPPDKALVNTHSSLNTNGNMLPSNSKLESYTKKFGQTFTKK